MNSFNTFQSLLLCSKKLLPKKLLEKILFHHKEDIFILFGKNYNDSFFLCEYNCTKNSYKVLTNTIDFEVRDILRLDENNLLLVSYDTLKIYNTLGEEIKTLVNEIKQAGNYDVTFDAKNLSSGVYFYRLQAGSFTEIKKMVLMK